MKRAHVHPGRLRKAIVLRMGGLCIHGVETWGYNATQEAPEGWSSGEEARLAEGRAHYKLQALGEEGTVRGNDEDREKK